MDILYCDREELGKRPIRELSDEEWQLVRRAFAMRMLSIGASIETAAILTKLPKEELKRLQDKVNKLENKEND